MYTYLNLIKFTAIFLNLSYFKKEIMKSSSLINLLGLINFNLNALCARGNVCFRVSTFQRKVIA